MTEKFRAAFSDFGLREHLAGRPSELARRFPFYPLDSPGMPKAGKDFVSQAQILAGDPDDYAPERGDMSARDYKRVCKAAYEEAVSVHLNRLYYRALYDDDFTLTIDVSGRPRTAAFILGHQWEFEADGPRPSRVMVVGKIPGREEANERRNFYGPTSQLFREALDESGIEGYDSWYVTNAGRFPSPVTHKTDVPAAWIADCLPLLHQELRLVKPEYLLLLGTEAITAVMGKGNSYKSTNGRVHDFDVPLHGKGEPERYHRTQIVTCVHPAAVAHDPTKRDDLYKALRYFRAVLDGTLASAGDPEAEREHIFCHSAEDLHVVANRLGAEKHKVFALDTEFDGDAPQDGQLHTIQFSWAAKKACVVNLRDEKGNFTFGGGPAAARRILTRILKGRDKRMVFHYAPADLWWLKHFGLGFVQDQFETPVDDPDPDGVERLFGWQKLKTEGGFDTILAAHAVEETSELGLKEQAVKYTTAGNYEVDLDRWKKLRAKELKCGPSELPGFGACPRNILLPYAAYDADTTFRLFQLYNFGGGRRTPLLDKDRFGYPSRIPFHISMRACLAFYEMHETGVLIDVQRAEQLYDLYAEVRDTLVDQLRSADNGLAWPEFNPSSVIHCREFLFGERYSGKIDKTTGEAVAVRPEGAVSLGLLPYKSTGKRPKLWDWVRARNKEDEYAASADKETLEVYKHLHPTVQKLLDIRYIQQILRSVLQPPEMRKMDDGRFDFELDEFGNRIYTRGLLSYRQKSGKVHTNFSQTKDTGRASSWSPPLQNISKKREPDYKRIVGVDKYKHTLRSMMVAPPGWAIVSADYTGAELDGMAIQAGSASMHSHCLRSLLATKGYDEDGNECSHEKGCKACVYPHPDYYDIHANVAVKAFQPKYPDGRPCREGRLARYDLKAAGLEHYRDAAKPVDFGYAYGMTADAAYRRAREGGANVTKDDSQALLDGLEALYPELPVYYAEAAERSRDPMWMVNCYGRRRRTYFTDDQKALGEVERQFKNFPIQSLVADAVSTAMANFRDYRNRKPHLRYRLMLQIHDDICLLVPVDQVEEVYDEVIPYCMTEAVDIWPCRLDGSLKDDPEAPYHLTPDRHVYLRWSEDITKEQALAAGLPLRFAK